MIKVTLAIISTIITATSFSLLILLIINISEEHQIELQRISDCVVAEAKIQGYAGNPYSQEAWELFSKNCK